MQEKPDILLHAYAFIDTATQQQDMLNEPGNL